jgi:hypothetical protein
VGLTLRIDNKGLGTGCEIVFTPEIRLALILGLAGKMIGGEARRFDV